MASLRSAGASQRQEILRSLRARGIEAAVHYPVPIHLQPSMKWLGLDYGQFPVAEGCSQGCAIAAAVSCDHGESTDTSCGRTDLGLEVGARSAAKCQRGCQSLFATRSARTVIVTTAGLISPVILAKYLRLEWLFGATHRLLQYWFGVARAVGVTPGDVW